MKATNRNLLLGRNGSALPSPDDSGYLDIAAKVRFFSSKNVVVEKNFDLASVKQIEKKKFEYAASVNSEYINYLNLLSKFVSYKAVENSLLNSSVRYSIERCVSLRDITVKECGTKHKEIVYHHCGENSICPRCQQRQIQERTEEIISKYEKFGIKRWKKRIYTIPECLRNVIYNDLNKFAEIIYRVEFRYHYKTMVAGLCILHEYSTEEPYKINPHAEIFIGDLGIKDRKTPIKINLWEEKEDLDRLRRLYKEELEKTYDVKINVVDIKCSYIDEINKMHFHSLPYALKPPLNPNWIKFVSDYGDDGYVIYSNDRNYDDDKRAIVDYGVYSGENMFLTIATVRDIAASLKLYYYSKTNFHRIRYFGFLANSVWKKYYELLFDEKPAEKPSVDDKEELICKYCGSPIVKIMTNRRDSADFYESFGIEVDYNPDLEVDEFLEEMLYKMCVFI